ncbi:hypothetical protein PVL29_005079 [Vitis rotundifolia]|uniref:Uncharacterized protein n=1 Tax=Vitis rotundifolia TaxID=103349 RepID=A0AA39AAS2_VITRO|nr:hypothetical protein PVL29_005079 [Vitis rotundifolia]
MAAFATRRYARKIGTVSGIRTALYKFKAFSVEGKSNSTSEIQFLAFFIFFFFAFWILQKI